MNFIEGCQADVADDRWPLLTIMLLLWLKREPSAFCY